MANVVKVQATPYDPIIQKATAALGGFTPGAMQTTAQRLAQGQIAPQLAAQNASNQAQQQLLSNLYNRQTGFSLALAKLADPNAQQAQGSYLAAANTMANLGQGLSGAVGQDWQGAADQARQVASGLTGGQGSVKGLYDPGSLQTTGYMTNFALPGAGLADQAVTAGADARNRQIASANQLGVLAANTQAQQAMQQTENARQLAAIRAQTPGIVQQSLANQQGLRQGAMETLASLTGSRAGYLQNAAQMAQSARQFGLTQAQSARQFGATQKQSESQFLASQLQQAQQFATTSGEQHLVNQATIAYNQGQLDVARKYLGQAGQMLSGKITAQNLQNWQGLQNATGHMVDMKTGALTNALAPGWLMYQGQRIPAQTYATMLTDQARIAMYESRMNSTDPLGKVTSYATKAIGAGAQQTSPTYTWMKNKDGELVRKQTKAGTPAIPYAQMLAQTIAMGPNTPEWQAKATQMVNARYPMGTSRPYQGQAAVKYANDLIQGALKKGLGYTAALASINQVAADWIDLPPAQIRQMIAKAYNYAPGSLGIAGATPEGARVGPRNAAVGG